MACARARRTRTSSRGGLRVFKIKMPAPVFVGDTIYAESEILDKRESKSRPTQGIVKARTIGLALALLASIVVTLRVIQLNGAARDAESSTLPEPRPITKTGVPETTTPERQP